LQQLICVGLAVVWEQSCWEGCRNLCLVEICFGKEQEMRRMKIMAENKKKVLLVVMKLVSGYG